MKCLANRLGPRSLAPSHSVASQFATAPHSPESGEPSRTIPFVTARPDHLARLCQIAAPMGFRFEGIESLDALADYLRAFPAAAVWTDASLVDGDWREVLALCRERSPDLPVFVTASSDSPALWAEAVQAGVAEWIVAPFAAPEVRRCLLLSAGPAEWAQPLQAAR